MFPQPIIYNPTNNNPSIIGGVVSPAEFSFFHRPVKNTRPSKTMTLWEVYLAIKSNQYQPQTALLRTFSESVHAKEYKAKEFDYVTFSGTFTSRKNDGLIKHSGLMSVDFDHLTELRKLKAALLKDRYFETDLLFKSPSGNGFKWIISIDTAVYSHSEWFLGIEKYIKEAYDLKIDPACKDVSRACFLPYDSEVYINPKYLRA